MKFTTPTFELVSNVDTASLFGERFMMAGIPWMINLWKPFDRRVLVLLFFDVDFVEVVLTIIDIDFVL